VPSRPSRPPTTAPPPFDPEEYARSSESALTAASDFKLTAEVPSPPPLNKRVRINVPASDLAWFDLSADACALAERLDGTTTLLDMLEQPGAPESDFLRIVAELHDARLLVYDD
jgi:hypothetical protein